MDDMPHEIMQGCQRQELSEGSAFGKIVTLRDEKMNADQQ